ncbi:MAG: Crp/Fnr family transcriptional regulator [Chloroflexaceae bacterium]|nr:Crp/Fnr family transcriptional regulator [Chloroflexaceae bacterium]
MNAIDSLTPEQLPPSLQAMMSRQTLSPGQILLQQGEPAKAVFFVELGRLRLASFTEQQVINHYFVEAGESFGETNLFSETYSCSAIATMTSRVIAIPKQSFLEALGQSPGLAAVVMQQMARQFRLVKTLLELRSLRSARDRVTRYLQLKLAAGSTINLDKPLKDVASELGLAPEVLSRTLARLEQEGTISRDRKSITFSEAWLEVNGNGHG